MLTNNLQEADDLMRATLDPRTPDREDKLQDEMMASLDLTEMLGTWNWTP